MQIGQESNLDRIAFRRTLQVVPVAFGSIHVLLLTKAVENFLKIGQLARPRQQAVAGAGQTVRHVY
jgi:hypothetical protein